MARNEPNDFLNVFLMQRECLNVKKMPTNVKTLQTYFRLKAITPLPSIVEQKLDLKKKIGMRNLFRNKKVLVPTAFMCGGLAAGTIK